MPFVYERMSFRASVMYAVLCFSWGLFDVCMASWDVLGAVGGLPGGLWGVFLIGRISGSS